MMLEPPTRLVVLSMEGPDSYALAGGLGARVTGLVRATAGLGIETHLVFVGDPDAPPLEVRAGGRLVLHRWGQWISRHHRGGVYDGEWDKVADYTASVPGFVASLVREALLRGDRAALLAEEWQTAEALCRTVDLLGGQESGRGYASLWNCNHPLCLDRVDWGRLQARARITTVSRYMRHRLLNAGVEARVVPNGIPSSMLAPAPPDQLAALQAALAGRLSLAKVGRWDPDKAWLPAVEAAARLRGQGVPVRLLLRGGVEPHGHEVLERARGLGLRVRDLIDPAPGGPGLITAVSLHADADVLNLRFRMTEEHKRLLFRACDAVLANSRMEPFGLVGLETMAAGGVAIVGDTGEDYATPGSALRVTTGTAEELSARIAWLRMTPAAGLALRRAGRRTAADFVWERVIATALWPTAWALRPPAALRSS